MGIDSWFWAIAIPVATPIVWEIMRRFGARHMTYQKLTARCTSVGDEYGHRKWNVTFSRKAPPQLAKWLLDVPGSSLEDTTVYGRFYHPIGDSWGESFINTTWEFVWSSKIPEQVQELLQDNTRLVAAKRARITKQDSQTVAVVMKVMNPPSCFVLDPRAYGGGLPGAPWGGGTLLLSRYNLALKVCHAEDTRGQVFFFELTDIGNALQSFSLRPLRKDEVQGFQRRLHDLFLG